MSVCFIAHRGYSGKYLENTEEAFRKAVEHGSGGIETDVRVTKDGVLVVNHNNEVIFDDGTEMVIADHTYEELTAKPLRNPFSKSTLYLCTFQRYLEVCRDGHMICFIEFKGSFTDEQIDRAFTMAREIYDLSMCELQSYDMDSLMRAHKAFPELKIMLTCWGFNPDVERALKRGFDIDMNYRGINQYLVDAFHQRGLKVGLWTANLRRELDYCLAQNVDFIESDYFKGAEGE